MVSFLCCVVYGTIDDCLRNSTILHHTVLEKYGDYRVPTHTHDNVFWNRKELSRATLIFDLDKTLNTSGNTTNKLHDNY